MTVSFTLSSCREGEQQKHTQARTHAGASRGNRMETETQSHRARESWKEREMMKGGTQTKNMEKTHHHCGNSWLIGDFLIGCVL